MKWKMRYPPAYEGGFAPRSPRVVARDGILMILDYHFVMIIDAVV